MRLHMTAQSACGNCRARHVCGMDESAQRTLEVTVPEGERYLPGEEVTVSMSRGMGLKAVLLAYVGAFVVLMGVLFGGAGALGWPEGPTIVAALAAVGIYYGVLYALRGRIRTEIHFKIHKS